MKSAVKHLLTILAIIAVSFSTPSCNKNHSDVTGTQDIFTCYLSQHLSKEALASKLVGTWQWTLRTCQLNGYDPADQTITVNFASDGSYMVSRNKAILNRGNWTLTLLDGEFYGLDLDSPSDYLYGRIIVCDRQLLFSDSYRDGCDNWFERVN